MGVDYCGTNQLTATIKFKNLRMLLEIPPIERITLESNDLYIFSMLVLK